MPDATHKPISSRPLFAHIERSGKKKADFAKQLNTSGQKLNNWVKRGVPAAELPRVAKLLGITVDQYLKQAGHQVELLVAEPGPPPDTVYVAVNREEQQLLDSYRRASRRWQLTLRLLAKLPSDDHEEAAESMNIVLAKIAADAVPDSRLGSNWTRPDKRRA